MTAELTEQELRQIREDGPGAVTAGTWDTLIDAALRDVRARGQKPVAWWYKFPMQGICLCRNKDEFDQLKKASETGNMIVELGEYYTSPPASRIDGLEEAAAFANDLWQDGIPSQEFGRRIRALADKEPT